MVERLISCALFAYGSLINTRSASRVLHREISRDEVVIADLYGFRRTWTALELVKFENQLLPKNITFLDVIPCSKSSVNGVIIKISAEEMSRLKVREKNYDALLLEESSLSKEIDVPVYTFASKEEYRIHRHSKDVCAAEKYIDLVRGGCLEFGDQFLKNFESSTDTPMVTCPGKYHFVDQEQSNFV